MQTPSRSHSSRDVVRVHSVDRERDDAAAPVGVGGPEHADALHVGQPLERVGGELALVGADVLHPEPGQVVDRRAKPHALGDRRGAGLELPGQLVPGRGVELHLRDHVAAAEERPHRLEQLATAVQHADAGRPERLVTGPDVEVRAELGHVRPGICGTACEASTSVSAPAARARAAISATGLIVPSTFETCANATSFTRPPASSCVELVERELALVGHGQVAQLGARLLAQELPGHDVRVVLHVRDHHLVAGRDVLAPPRVRHEVDRLGRVAS